MPTPTQLLAQLNAIGQALAASGHGVALIGLGSVVLRDHVLGPLPPDWTVRIPQTRRLFGESKTTAATAVAWLAACNRAVAA